MSVRILTGDCRELLSSLDAGSVQTCVTSPPYFGLRDYGVAGQIGLEATPEAFVAELVSVFREVRRVLRDDGTLWLNLGDSYANDTKWGGQTGGKHVAALHSAGGLGREKRTTGLKAKDLIGIPWRVATALQQPYYAGKIRDERDRIWLAAMLDAEGCLFIHKRKAGQSNGQGYERKNDSYGPGVEISNTHRAIVERIASLVGKGSICEQGPEQNDRRRQTLYRWNLRTTESREFVRELYPYLIAKQHQARILCGCPSSGADAERAHEALKLLHQGGTTTVDFKAPASMFESGYYLRSDIIWSKSNPMPESVTDRPTKAHEYLFLLSKSATYYYDADAIAEAASEAEHMARYAGRYSTDNPNRNDRGPSIVGGGPTRNRRTVWTVATQPYSGAHFATFPPALIEPCILAGSAKQACETCGAPWERLVEREAVPVRPNFDGKRGTLPKSGDRGGSGGDAADRCGNIATTTLGFAPMCDCETNTGAGRSVVLDPFGGAGTTGLVADRLGRGAILCELNPEYAELARRRITDDSPLFGDVA